MSTLAEKLDVLLGEADQPADEMAVSCKRLVTELKQLRRREAELERQLAVVGCHLMGSLALQLRREAGGLNVALSEAGCRVGYRDKWFILVPDLLLGAWRVQSDATDLADRFRRENRQQLAVTEDVAILAAALAECFASHYRSLNESITGCGVLLVDGKASTLLDLAGWRLRHKPIYLTISLPTRRVDSVLCLTGG